MQSKSDPRHTKRRLIVKSLYANSFLKQSAPADTKKILANLKGIDDTITKAAPGRPLSEINKVDLAILRLAVYELQEKKVPSKVVIDEAVELAKEFGAESAPSFVNGVLGTIMKHDKGIV